VSFDVRQNKKNMKNTELLESKIKKQKNAITVGLIVLSVFGIILYIYLLGRERPIKMEALLYPVFFAYIGLFLVFRKILGFQQDTISLIKQMKQEPDQNYK
jgi:hypothetical protein